MNPPDDRLESEPDIIGKVDHESLIRRVLNRTGATDPAVRQGAAIGEDAAAIEFGDQTLVVSTDPLSLAATQVGTLAIHVACNDVASSGAEPRWLTSSIFLPNRADHLLNSITAQIDETAQSLDVTIIGGHTEYLPSVSRPLLSMTCLGTTDRFVPTGGANPGDVVMLTKAAGIEATAILASDFPELVSDLPSTLQESSNAFLDEISVVAEARILRETATAMHDPTEGGVLTGLIELAIASGLPLKIDRSAIPVRTETETLCGAVSIDPLETFGSGALLATIPPNDEESVVERLSVESIPVSTIGRVEDGPNPGVRVDGSVYRSPIRDAMYGLWSQHD